MQLNDSQVRRLAQFFTKKQIIEIFGANEFVVTRAFGEQEWYPDPAALVRELEVHDRLAVLIGRIDRSLRPIYDEKKVRCLMGEISEDDFWAAIVTFLRRADCVRIVDLVVVTESCLLGRRFPGIGNKYLRVIKSVLDEMGLSLAMRDNDPNVKEARRRLGITDRFGG